MIVPNSVNLSIIIPAYNSEATIKATLQSVSSQTYSNIEIIVVDDCSTDNTVKVVTDCALHDSRIRLIKCDLNRGCFFARKLGVKYATGAYLFFLDSDDLISSNLCESAVNELSKASVDILCISVVPIRAGLSNAEQQALKASFSPLEITLYDEGIVHASFRDREIAWNLCGKFMRTSLVKQAFAALPDKNIFMGEDAFGYFSVAYHAHSLKGCPDIGDYCYQLDFSESNSVNNAVPSADDAWRRFSMRCSMSIVADAVYSFIQDRNCTDTYLDDYKRLRSDLLGDVVQHYFSLPDEKQKAEGYKEMLKYWQRNEVSTKIMQLRPSEVNTQKCVSSLKSMPHLLARIKNNASAIRIRTR